MEVRNLKKLIKWGLIGFIGLIVLFVIIGSSGNGDTSQPSSVKEGATTQEQEEVVAEEALEVNVQEFIDDFDKNQLAAEEKHSGKLVKLTSYIDNISEDILGTPFLSLKPAPDEYYFDTSIQCYFKDKSELTSLENGQQVTISGRVDTQELGIISIKDCQVVE